jgi:hypothetical protein
MDSKTVRNVAIVLAIAAAVYFVPGGGRAAGTFESALIVGFGVAFGYLGLRMYRERRVAIYSLGDRHRALLYGAVAVSLFLWLSSTRMFQTGVGELVWFVLLAGVLWAAMELYRRVRSY